MRTIAFRAQPSLNISLSSTHLRTLTTRPARIPRYVRPWDPASHPSSRPKKPAHENIGTDYVTYRRTREHLRSTEGRSLSDSSIGRHHAIRRLERCLKLANTDISDKELRHHLWRAYALAKEFAPDRLEILPDKAWDVLWASWSIQRKPDRFSRAHLEELYKDMQKVGKILPLQQRIKYWKSLCLSGKQQEALLEWNDELDQMQATDDGELDPRFLEIGVEVHVQAEDVDRAYKLWKSLYKTHPKKCVALMSTVFEALTRSETSKHHDAARDIYAKLRRMQGDRSTLDHLDVYFVGFIRARHLQYAKEVFCDMVKDGLIATSYSQSQIDAVLERLDRLYRLATDIAKATSIGLQAITILPQAYHSHVFGAWMKLAVIKSAPEAAAQILDMIFKRGHEPETFHCNILLKALFRSKQRPHELKAENIAWHMVDELVKSSEIKTRAASGANIVARAQSTAVSQSNEPPLPRQVPPANVGTIALLMQYYERRSQWEHVEYLTRQIKDLKIQPNTDLMNVLLHIQCRQGNYNKVWDLYRSLTEPPESVHGVFPNGATFRCLWLCLRLALGSHEARETLTLPSPRQLFAETIRWWNLVRRRFDAERFRQGLATSTHGALNSLVMHCFSYTKDLPGALVALHALRQRLEIFPSDKAVDILQNHIAWVDLHKEPQSYRREYARTKVHQKKLEQMAEVYLLVQSARFKRMKLTGDQYAYMTTKEKGDLYLNTLSEFIRVVWKRQLEPAVIEERIDTAKWEMGVANLATGDVDAFTVA